MTTPSFLHTTSFNRLESLATVSIAKGGARKAKGWVLLG